MKIIRRRDRNSESGTQLAELAIALPLLAVLFFLVADDGGGLVRAHQVLNNAAREGARFGARPESGSYDATADVKTRVTNYITADGHLDSTKLTTSVVFNEPVTYSDGTRTINATATKVTISYPYTLGWFSVGASKQVTLQTTATFRNFWNGN